MSSTQELSFFVLGATGYIGGAAILAIQKQFPSATYVAYTRSKSNAPALEALGLRVLISGTNPKSDHDVITKAVTVADVVIDCADADDLPLAKAVIRGLKENTKKWPIWIHTSGTGVLADKPTGAYQEGKIWDDSIEEDIKSIDPAQPHRDIDLAIFAAQKEEYSINYIIAPSTIYGIAFDNPVHKISQQVPKLINDAIKAKQAIYAGEGTNIWNNVHIYDLADLYAIIVRLALQKRSTLHSSSSISPSTTLNPYSQFYWGSVGSHTFGGIAKLLGPILYRKGKVETEQAKSVPPETVPWYLACDSRSVSSRGFKDGWKPKQKSIEDTLEEDVDGVLNGLR